MFFTLLLSLPSVSDSGRLRSGPDFTKPTAPEGNSLSTTLPGPAHGSRGSSPTRRVRGPTSRGVLSGPGGKGAGRGGSSRGCTGRVSATSRPERSSSSA